jgi:hypothetical protein
MMRISLPTVTAVAIAMSPGGCSDDDGPSNPTRLWLKAVEIVGTVELVAEEPDPY